MIFEKKVSMLLDDYIDFNMFNAKKKILLGTLVPISIFTILMILLGLAILIKQVAYCLFIIVILPTLTISGIITFIKKEARKQYSSSKSMQTPSTVTINDTKVIDVGANGYIAHEWNDIYQAVESKKAIYVYISNIQAIVIPKRLLTHEEEDTLRNS